MSHGDPRPDEDQPSTSDPYFVSADEGSRHVIFPGVEIQTTAGWRMMLSVIRLEAESVVKPHSHPHEQMGILLEGRLEFTIGEVTRIVGPGDKWRIPGGVVHHVKAVGGPAVALDVFCPIREDYL